MRYSRMLEESSFANRKADYFWLLFLSAFLLLVRPPSSISFFLTTNILSAPLPAFQPSFPLLATGFRPHLLLVAPPPVDSHLSLWPRHDYGTLPTRRPRRIQVRCICASPFIADLLIFSWILNGTPRAAAGDLIGCAVGHFGWFVRDVWIRELPGGSLGWCSHAPDPM